MLPRLSGIDVCRAIRANPDGPIIMVTAKSTELDTVVGLEVGADDYVAKPYRVHELVSRMRAVLRRTPGLHAAANLGPIPSVVHPAGVAGFGALADKSAGGAPLSTRDPAIRAGTVDRDAGRTSSSRALDALTRFSKSERSCSTSGVTNASCRRGRSSSR